jgi:hypothetical protein
MELQAPGEDISVIAEFAVPLGPIEPPAATMYKTEELVGQVYPPAMLTAPVASVVRAVDISFVGTEPFPVVPAT